MTVIQALLRRIPEPSVRLFVVLTVFAALAVICLGMLSGSGHDGVVHHVQAD